MQDSRDIAARSEAVRADLEKEIGSRSPRDMQDMSHEKRTELAQTIVNDHFAGIVQATVQHRGNYDRVLIVAAKRDTEKP